MFEFFQEFDKDIYDEIINEVEFNMWNDRCVSIIQSEIEKIAKKLFQESNIVITNVGNNGIVYREYNPSLSKLFNNDDFKKFLLENQILTLEDINSYWNILASRNIKEHGPKLNQVLNIDATIKEDALKFLFKLCYNTYIHQFGKQPNAYWDEKYFQKLLVKPVEKVVEKEIKVIDNTELEIVKKEHEELKKQLKQLENLPKVQTGANLDLLNKLGIAKKCLESKDFENAKMALNNCKRIDISCYEIYELGIFVDYKAKDMQELGEIFRNYKVKTMQEFERHYQDVLDKLNENNNIVAIKNFCNADAQIKFKEFKEKLKESIEYALFGKYYDFLKKDYLKVQEKYRNERERKKYNGVVWWLDGGYLSELVWIYKIRQCLYNYKDAAQWLEKILKTIEDFIDELFIRVKSEADFLSRYYNTTAEVYHIVDMYRNLFAVDGTFMEEHIKAKLKQLEEDAKEIVKVLK